MFLQWRGRLYANLLATAHFTDTGLIDEWLRGSSVESTKDLGLNRYLVEMPKRQSLMTTHSLLAVKDVLELHQNVGAQHYHTLKVFIPSI